MSERESLTLAVEVIPTLIAILSIRADFYAAVAVLKVA